MFAMIAPQLQAAVVRSDGATGIAAARTTNFVMTKSGARADYCEVNGVAPDGTAP
jgi:hypothetical protein